MNTYKDIYKRKKTMNDINPTTGLPMSGGGIDAGGTPYGNSSNGFDDGCVLACISLVAVISCFCMSPPTGICRD